MSLPTQLNNQIQRGGISKHWKAVLILLWSVCQHFKPQSLCRSIPQWSLIWKSMKEQTAEKSIHGILGATKNFPPIIHQSIIGYNWAKSTEIAILSKSKLMIFAAAGDMYVSVNINCWTLVKFLRGSRAVRPSFKSFWSPVAGDLV